MEKDTFKVKAKYKQPFDTFGCILWLIFLPIIGLIVAAFLCREKYYIVLELVDEKRYFLRKISVCELELYKVDENDIVEEEIENNISTYWVLKDNKKVKIKTK